MFDTSLFYYNQKLCGDRDCTSTFFECVDEELFRVNRFFYNSKTFISYLKSDSNNDNSINYLNLKRLSYVVDKNELIRILFDLINKISNRISTNELNSLETMLHQVRSICENLETTDNVESAELLIDELNKTLLGYQYYFGNGEQKFYFNEEFFDSLKNNSLNIPYVKNVDNEEIVDCIPEQYKAMEELDLFELRVYSVGQANCSALVKYVDEKRDDYSVVVVFDFGLEDGKKNLKLEEMINKIDENTTIIISHFDTDHINNISKFALDKTCRWLFPEQEPEKNEANLLYQDLLKAASRKSKSGKTVFCFKTPFSLSNYLRINQNTGPIGDTKHQRRLINSQCIIATLHTDNTKVLIPADALYKDFPADVFNYDYDFVLVPHHGCRYCEKSLATTPYYESIKKIVLDKTEGVVMCGCEGKKYGHANTKHLNWYNYVCTFDDASFYLAKGIIDLTYRPTRIEKSDFYSILFK